MTAIAPGSRPRLAAKARLLWDRHAGKHMLVYPERGLVLNETAAAILVRCDGEHTVAEIAAELAGKCKSGLATTNIEDEVATFLEAIREKGLVRVETR
jgi:coenzyme PQQ biosynthesis protein PqqD